MQKNLLLSYSSTRPYDVAPLGAALLVAAVAVPRWLAVAAALRGGAASAPPGDVLGASRWSARLEWVRQLSVTYCSGFMMCSMVR